MKYAYEAPNGKIHWHEQRMADGPPPVQIETPDGTAKRCYQAENKGGSSPKGWPMACYASGVHPSQAQELRDEFERVGVPTEVNKNGDPIYTSPEHRRRALKARGFHDRAAYY